MKATRIAAVLLAAALSLGAEEIPELRAMGRRPLGIRTPVIFVHGHGMADMAAPLYATWAKFLQGRAEGGGADWWLNHKPYLFTYRTAAADQDYRKIGDLLGKAILGHEELFADGAYRPVTPLVGVTFSAGALVWHQAMRALPAEKHGAVYSVSPPTQGTVGAVFLGAYALDRGGPEATAAFRTEYERKFKAALASDFQAVYPADYRAEVRAAHGAADDAGAGKALADQHWKALVEVYEDMSGETSAAAFRTLAFDNLGPGGGPLVDPTRLSAMGAVDLDGRPFVNHWLRELHRASDYTKATVYMGKGNTSLKRKGLAGLLAGGGPGGGGRAEHQRQIVQDVTRSAAMPEGLADADPTVPRALGSGEFLPAENRPRVVYVTRMSHHQGAFHPGVLLHIHDAMTRLTSGWPRPGPQLIVGPEEGEPAQPTGIFGFGPNS